MITENTKNTENTENTENTDFYRTQSVSYDNYQNFNFETLSDMIRQRYSNQDNDFISYSDHQWHMLFEAKTGLQHLSGCNLLKYPELAQVLQKLDNYPILSIKYPLNIKHNLITYELLRAFAEVIEHAQKDFEAKKAAVDAIVNNYIFIFGQTESAPLYQGATAFVKESESEYRYIQNTQATKIIISGATYFLQNNTHYPKPDGLKDCEMLFLRDIAKTELSPYSIDFIGGIKETPYIEVQVKTNWKNKGHEIWLDMRNNCVIKRKDAFINAQKLYKVDPLKNFEALKISVISVINEKST